MKRFPVGTKLRLNAGDSVVVKGWRGVAFRVLEPVQVWIPCSYLKADPETGEEFEVETGEGEWVCGDGSRVRVHMVGDDRVYEVNADDCSPLPDDEFCGSCGQIGCGHGGNHG